MPISGAKFTNQIAMCMQLLECGYIPDIILASSGGCITSMILLVCDIASIKCTKTYQIFLSKLNSVLKELDNSWYLTPWSQIPVLNTIYGIGCGSLFDRGRGESFMSKYPINISRQPETWIGTHSVSDGQSQIFCTKTRKDSAIRIKGAKYMDCDLDYITKASIASCAVPKIVPPMTIDGVDYIDGGVSHASPLGPCMPAFEAGQVSFHIVYISPVRYSIKEDPQTAEIEDDDVWNQIRSSTAGMVTGLHLPDRNNGIRAVGENPTQKNGIGKKGLFKALKKQKQSIRSFIELAPLEAEHLNFLTMSKGEAYESVYESYKNGFSVRHWFIAS